MGKHKKPKIRTILHTFRVTKREDAIVRDYAAVRETSMAEIYRIMLRDLEKKLQIE